MFDVPKIQATMETFATEAQSGTRRPFLRHRMPTEERL